MTRSDGGTGEALHYIYMLHASGDRLYTGYTTDPVRRLSEHIAGRGKAARFTRAFSPSSLAACWRLSCSRGEAMKVEAAIKKLTRREKLHLIESPDGIEDLAAVSCGRRLPIRREEREVIEKSARPGLRGQRQV